MMKLKKLCRKNTISKIILSAAIVFGINTYAADFIPAPEFKNFEAVQTFSGIRENIQLFSSVYSAPKMDFSRLNGSLTIEVSGDLSAGAVLFIAEYNDTGDLLKTHMIEDVLTSNTINVEGSYERAYLWNFAKMTPLCANLTTKADYEIIEGIEGEWEVSDDGHTLYKYTGTSKDVIIPNSYRGKRINTIENSHAINSSALVDYSSFRQCNVFGGRSDITSIKIPEGIKIIGSLAFFGCTQITNSAVLPSTAYLMGDYSFYDCKSMTGEIDLSNFVYIGNCAYYNCSKITGSLNLSKLRVNIGDNVFSNCKELNGTVTLPTGITSIGAGAFSGCPKLKGALNIPEGVERLEHFAFSNDSGFTSLTLPSTLKYIGIAAFQLNNKLSNKLVLPDGLEHISDFAFSHTNFSNTSLIIPDSVHTIGGNYNVEENTYYGGHVFYNSFKKTTEFIADSDYFKAVDGVLYSKDMTRLVMYPAGKTDESFVIPEGVAQLDEMSFGYSKVKNVTLPDSFVISEDVPANIINDMANNLAVAFYHFNGLQNIYFNETNPNYTSVNGFVYSKDLKELWYVPTNKTGTITIPEGTEKIRKGAFYIEHNAKNSNGVYTSEKYTGVHIPASVTEIHNENLISINKRPIESITVDENNEHYTVVNGKLTVK